MNASRKTKAPNGRLDTFERAPFNHGGMAHDVYRKGCGPAVLVLTELPGISPQVLGFADRLVALGCSAIVPDLFGVAGRDAATEHALSRVPYQLRSLSAVCISREFSVFASGRTSPIVRWLRSLAACEHERCGGPGVGVVGMCFTGGFALAMAADPRVLVPVLSQPALPMRRNLEAKHSIDCDPDAFASVAQRCKREGLRVLGLRFKDDPFVPAERFALLRERLGDGFIAIELEQSAGHPDGMLPHRHSVLTGDLIDEPGEPTREALGQVLELLRSKLLPSSQAPVPEPAS